MGRAVLQNTRELFLKLLRIPQIDQKQHDLLLLQHGHLPGICLIFQARRYDLKHAFGKGYLRPLSSTQARLQANEPWKLDRLVSQARTDCPGRRLVGIE